MQVFFLVGCLVWSAAGEKKALPQNKKRTTWGKVGLRRKEEKNSEKVQIRRL